MNTEMFHSVFHKAPILSRPGSSAKKLVCLLFVFLFLGADGLCKFGASAAAYPKSFTARPATTVTPYRVYLSPSAQPWNPYCDGSGSEEDHMRQIAEAMIPYLKGYGIESVLAAPSSGGRAAQRTTIVNRTQQAADSRCDLYLAIHSNAQEGILNEHWQENGPNSSCSSFCADGCRLR
ncbi:MAG TPA: hypothetical protein VHR42_06775, partial [Clostridia bacterium]|nr:hypothetical protein [Clostridia bacterium]